MRAKVTADMNLLLQTAEGTKALLHASLGAQQPDHVIPPAYISKLEQTVLFHEGDFAKEDIRLLVIQTIPNRSYWLEVDFAGLVCQRCGNPVILVSTAYPWVHEENSCGFLPTKDSIEPLPYWKAVTILHFSDVYRHLARLREMIALLEDYTIQPDALLVTGITRNGAAIEHAKAKMELLSLIHRLNLKQDRVILLPGSMDMSAGISQFDILFQGICGSPYRYEDTQAIRFDNGIQIFGMDTVLFNQYPNNNSTLLYRLNAVLERWQDPDCPLRIMLNQTPYDLHLQHHSGAITQRMSKHHIFVGLHGDQNHWSSTPTFQEVGTADDALTVLRCMPRHIAVIRFPFQNKRWQKPHIHTLSLPRQVAVPCNMYTASGR